MQTPSVGRIVIVESSVVASNGTDIAPAIITRTWGENLGGGHTVNVTAFPDNAPARPVSSVRLYADREAALADELRAEATVAYWPPRIG